MSLKSVAKVTCSLSHHRARTELNLVPTFARTRTLANNKIRTRIGTSARNNFMCTFMTRNHALNSTQIHLLSSPFPRDFSHRQNVQKENDITRHHSQGREHFHANAQTLHSRSIHTTRVPSWPFSCERDPYFMRINVRGVQLVYAEAGFSSSSFKELFSSRVSKTLNCNICLGRSSVCSSPQKSYY